MAVPPTYLLLAAFLTALCQGMCTMPCEQFLKQHPCTFFSCSTTDKDVTCLYRNASTNLSMVPTPQWHLDDERIQAPSLQLTEYNDTVWQMVYNYSALSPGEYVFQGKFELAPAPIIQDCCGPQPDMFLILTVAADNSTNDVDKKDVLDSMEVFLNLTVAADNPTDDDEKDELDSVVLRLGRSMKELVLGIVKIVDEATGDDMKH